MNNLYNSLDHAKHNEKVCDIINKEKEYQDWVVTTAFYSALHYLRETIFPFDMKFGKKTLTVPTFDHYCIVKKVNISRHALMKRLVKEKCPRNISQAYIDLLDASYNSRYNDYRVSDLLAKTSKKRLLAIKNFYYSSLK